MQEVGRFKHLGVMISADDNMEEEIAHRVMEGRNVWGIMANL